jgi:hypothetical protein
MIFGVTILTFMHVLLSLIGIFTGLVVTFGLLTAKQLNGWTGVFIRSTVATSVTGFLFPFHKLLPSHAGAVSLLVLAIAIYALYGGNLAGVWRKTYAINAVIVLHFECVNVDRSTV